MFKRFIPLAIAVASVLQAYGQANGIFADFTTSMGNFSCQLDYTNAPGTVANFIALASGARPWLDLPTGRARTNAFYNGLLFHRVKTNFMIQGGSPNGLGTDGPGYALTNQFSPKLTFGQFGTLAMANSGPNSDGSQFFITVAPFTSGNSNYTIFGSLSSGSNVVFAISSVAVDTSNNDRPLTNVVMQQVNIRRVGTAAQAFDINAQGLPWVTNIPLRIARVSTNISLTLSNRRYADNRLYFTTNVAGTWTPNLLGVEVPSVSSNTTWRNMSAPRGFYRMAQVQYASSTWAPKTMNGKTLTLSANGWTGAITIVFDNSNGGAFTESGVTSGSILGYSWSQDLYRGTLWPVYFLSENPIGVQLTFSSASAGTYSGYYYFYYGGQYYPFSISGTFNLSW